MDWTAAGRLFQARMWREYAMKIRNDISGRGIGRYWVVNVIGVSEGECLRRSRVNIYLARRINRNKRI